MSLRYDGQVVVVTGAGGGIGKHYAIFFATRGAKVVVNDLGTPLKDITASREPADKVVEEIRAKGGIAIPDYNSVVEGEKIIKTALDNFGRIDVLINNAGIVRGPRFWKMTYEDWRMVLDVHLDGSYKCTKAAWNTMREQGYGRIINTSSPAGLYGSTQSDYSTAKLGLHGFTLALAL